MVENTDICVIVAGKVEVSAVTFGAMGSTPVIKTIAAFVTIAVSNTRAR